MVTTALNIRPSERDRQVLWHVLRYGLTTQEAVYRLFFDPQSNDLEAARSNLKRLRNGGYLNKVKEPVPYYRLTKRAVAYIEPLLGVTRGRYDHAWSILMKPQLLQRLAVHAFCCLGDTPRRVLLQHEFIHFFHEFSRTKIHPWPYYIESTPDGSVLCLIVVDSHSHPAHQVHRVEKHVRRRLGVPAIRELRLAGRFRVTLLTTTAQRALEIRAALYEAHVDGVQLETVPQLSSILLEPEPTP
jgi:hypothetical protein